MKILFLGTKNNKLFKHLKEKEDGVLHMEDKIDLSFLKIHNPDFIISYGYRHIIKKEVIDLYKDRAINLHISYLPWNKGADPNFWSLVENTPRGVTIHYIDEGLDTGDIIVQKEVEFKKDDTLKTSYENLQITIQELFINHWDLIKSNTCQRVKQTEEGTLHKTKDKEPHIYLLTDGWDTPITVLEEYNIQ